MWLRMSQVSITLQVCYLYLKSGWKVSPLTSIGAEIKFTVASYLRKRSWILVGQAEFLPRISYRQRGFPFSEFRSVSHYFVADAVPTIENSSRMLLFCWTFHWRGHSFLVRWCSVRSSVEWCQCKPQVVYPTEITKLKKRFPFCFHK
jgi:hypothetical protein